METKKFPFTYLLFTFLITIIRIIKTIRKGNKVYDVLNAYLENGLKIVIHKISEVKTVACGLWIKLGSSYETDDNNGLSHLAEHLLMNQNDVENEEYKRIISDITDNGVYYNAATTKEYTCYYFTGLKSTIDDSLNALSQIAMKNREFNEDAFENEKKVVLQEAVSFYSSFQQIKERTSQALWGNMGTGKIIMGNLNNIENATKSQVLELINKAYVPENAILTIVGNVDYTDILQKIENKFGIWDDVKVGLEERNVESEPGIYINKGSGNSTVLSIGLRAPGYGTANRLAVEMMVRILGSGSLQSRIVTEIRGKRGLAYNVGGFASFFEKRGTIGFTVVCDKNRSIETAKVLSDVIIQAREHGFNEDEIIREKHVMETNMILAIDNITEHLKYIGRCSSMDKNFYIENEIRLIRNIQKEYVDRAAKQLLCDLNMGVAVIGSSNAERLLETIAV
ncbi:MAG: insulinase family protein [[Eubacterium] rectale]|nr:insulinase family protein [Agathobacter rectalis]